MILHTTYKKNNDIMTKLTWFNQYFLDHEAIVKLENPNSMHSFNWFGEESHLSTFSVTLD